MDPQDFRGRVQRPSVGTTAQKRLFDLATAGLHDQTRAALDHLLGSTRQRLKKGREVPPWIPLPSTFLRAAFPKADLAPLVESGVLELREHDRHGGLCREYRFALGWYLLFVQAGGSDGDEAHPAPVVILSGDRARPRRSRLTDRHENRLPPIVRDGINAVGPSLYNATAAKRHLETRLAVAESSPDDAAAVARYLVDAERLAAVHGQRPEPWGEVHGEVIMSYQPALVAQRNGRVTEVGGGLQSCTREMKEAARFLVPDAVNYDLDAAHARILTVELDRAGVDGSWLAAYLANPEAKVTAAAAVGVSTGVWKGAMYALLNGARVPTPRQLAFSDGDLVRAFRDAGGEWETAYARFFEYVEGLRVPLAEWQGYLVDVWAEVHGVRVAANNRTYVRNAVGMSRALEDMAPSGQRHELTAKLVAFVLQGHESNVIHRIASSYNQFGFRIMSNEHDGLITLGEVPDTCVTDAAVAAGLPPEVVVLREKPYV